MPVHAETDGGSADERLGDNVVEVDPPDTSSREADPDLGVDLSALELAPPGTCPPLPSPPAKLGFDPAVSPWDVWMHGTATIVETERLVLDLPSGRVEFHLKGPSLVDVFMPGDAVVVSGRVGRWDVVRGPGATVGTWSDDGFMGSWDLKVISGGPALTYYLACGDADPQPPCGLPANEVRQYGVRARMGNQMIDVHPGTSGDLGGWRIVHHVTRQRPYYSARSCIGEASWRSALGLMGPPRPPECPTCAPDEICVDAWGAACAFHSAWCRKAPASCRPARCDPACDSAICQAMEPRWHCAGSCPGAIPGALPCHEG